MVENLLGKWLNCMNWKIPCSIYDLQWFVKYGKGHWRHFIVPLLEKWELVFLLLVNVMICGKTSSILSASVCNLKVLSLPALLSSAYCLFGKVPEGNFCLWTCAPRNLLEAIVGKLVRGTTYFYTETSTLYLFLSRLYFL